MSLYLVILVVYAALLTGIGLWLGRSVRSSSEFFVAGRRLGPGLLFSTMLAANIGAGSTVNAAALGYRDGLSAWWWIGSAGLGSIVLAWWVGPAIRRVAQERDLHTVGDFLEYRYGGAVRAVVALLLWLGTLAILAAQLIAGAVVLGVVAGIDRWLGCVIAGVAATVYFAAGGLLTAAWINMLQLVVLLLGFVVVLPLALGGVGGWETVRAGTQHLDSYWSIWQGGDSGWIYLAMLGPAFIVSPGLLQKVYGARDDRTVKVGVLAMSVVLLVFAAVPPLLGMMARSVMPTLANQDLALPVLLVDVVPPLVGAIGLAALFSAELSSADAILFMLATSLARDLYRRFLKPSATDGETLRVARLAAVAGGTLATGLAITADTIVDTLQFFYTLLTVSLFVPVVAGLYTTRAGPPEALASITAGVAFAVVTQTATDGRGIGGLTPAMLGLAAAAIACGLVTVTSRQRGRRQSSDGPPTPPR